MHSSRDWRKGVQYAYLDQQLWQLTVHRGYRQAFTLFFITEKNNASSWLPMSHLANSPETRRRNCKQVHIDRRGTSKSYSSEEDQMKWSKKWYRMGQLRRDAKSKHCIDLQRRSLQKWIQCIQDLKVSSCTVQCFLGCAQPQLYLVSQGYVPCSKPNNRQIMNRRTLSENQHHKYYQVGEHKASIKAVSISSCPS